MSRQQTTGRHHRIDYTEIPAPDLLAAKEFYGRAFGWGFNDYGPGPAYVGIRAVGGTEEEEVGGLNPEGRPGDGGLLVLMYSDDLDASLASVAAAGGRVTSGPFEFPGGRRFHFHDPAGNELGVWSEH